VSPTSLNRSVTDVLRLGTALFLIPECRTHGSRDGGDVGVVEVGGPGAGVFVDRRLGVIFETNAGEVRELEQLFDDLASRVFGEGRTRNLLQDWIRRLR
jgi:hypothetical protein